MPKFRIRRNAALQQALSGAAENENEASLAMRMYSPDELDVMAEAYLKALDKLPVEMPTVELTQRLVQEIGEAVASGIRDEDALAATALQRSNIRADL